MSLEFLQEISASCSPEMEGNKLMGTLELIDFEMSLQWSKVGNLHMHLLQVRPVVSA